VLPRPSEALHAHATAVSHANGFYNQEAEASHAVASNIDGEALGVNLCCTN
jgi:hypothetical protein